MTLDPPFVREPKQTVFVQISSQIKINLFEGGRVAELRCFDQPYKLAVVPVIPLGVHQMA
ncbi:unnamed protein product [marine sediment metagenome]|uniref:Uncharacterized protein n=1 Tax=marine sediment metagenome TaxID=412755 RepID=X1FX78_9ZZZZ